MPIGWVAAAGVVGSIATGVLSSNASEHAADQQANASANAQAISQQQYNDTVARNAPFTQAGYGALSALDWGLGIGPQTSSGAPVQYTPSGTPGTDPSSGYHIGRGGSISQLVSNGSPAMGLSENGISLGQLPGQHGTASAGQGVSGSPIAAGSAAGTAPGQQTAGLGYGSLTTPFTTANWQQLSPAYNFQVQQGRQGVLNADTAGAGALSGAAQKDLIDYNQNAANTSFNNAFNQYQTQQGNIFSRLSGIAQLGESSANNTGQQGTALAGQAAQSATNIGTAQAGGTIGSANAISGGINNAIPWLTAGGGGSNNNASNWDTENPNNFQDFASSDRRLKTHIHMVGKLESGLNVYTFKYSSDPTITHMGVMADEVEKVIPKAVATGADGFKVVHYGMLH